MERIIIMAGINSFLQKIKEVTGGESFAQSRFGDVNNWISTGSYALNRILSGSIYKGIPSGRIVILGGESSSGKSLISAFVAANALKEGYDAVFYFDSEGGALKEFFENVGCDTEKIIQILVSSVEDAQKQILKTIDMIQEFKENNPESKFLCVLDSLGGLVPEKLFKDAEKDKVTSEMGGRAKVCLIGDTLVLMSNNEYKQIKDIVPGDEVITHLNRVRKVLDNTKTKHKQYVQIKVNGEILKMSLTHKMLVSRNGELQYIEAQNILPTDKLIKLNN